VPGEVTLEEVEASVWRLLASASEGRDGSGVSARLDAVLVLVRRYGECVARQREVEMRRRESAAGKEKEGVKRCSTCGRELAIAEFHRNTSRPDGRQSRCKECAGAARRARTRVAARQREAVSVTLGARFEGAGTANGA